MVTRAAAAMLLLGCGAHSHAGTATAPTSPIDQLELYRGTAIVRRVLPLALAAGASTITVEVADGVTPDNFAIIDRGGVQIAAIHAQPPTTKRPAASDGDDDDDGPPRVIGPAVPTTLAIDLVAPRAGHYTLELAYVTPALAWDAAYAMTATAAHDRSRLHGALAIHNRTGVAFQHARTTVIDAELGGAGGRIAERLAATGIGGTESSTPPTPPRELGTLDVPIGETRVELVPDDGARPMRSVLVYNPIGTRLDNLNPDPLRTPNLGVEQPASTKITESFEVDLDDRLAGLPAGPLRLFERAADGTLGVLGEARLFEAAARKAPVATIALGAADGVTGHRERRELTVDDDRQRLVEEFAITLDNARAHAIEVVVREHLYRGQNWNLVYYSAPTVLEGAQQIAMRTTVPAHGHVLLVYVVAYTW